VNKLGEKNYLESLKKTNAGSPCLPKTC
jgi:hypothetical protein